jgi:hypothetical protein
MEQTYLVDSATSSSSHILRLPLALVSVLAPRVVDAAVVTWVVVVRIRHLRFFRNDMHRSVDAVGGSSRRLGAVGVRVVMQRDGGRHACPAPPVTTRAAVTR